MVVTQTPAAGDSVNSDTVIELVLSTSPAGVQPPIRLRIGYPGYNTVVHNHFGSTISLDSLYEIASAVASLGGREVTMTYAGSYNVTVNIADMPSGPLLLTRRVTDVRGNFAELKHHIIRDVPPTVRITSPANDSVVLSTLAIDVTCVDDFPGCQVLVESQGELLAEGAGGVVATLDLSRWSGREISVGFNSYDSRGQRALVSRKIFVETSPRLSRVITYPGRILDFDGDRVLTLEAGDPQQPSTHSLSVLTREPIPWPSGWYVNEGFSWLTPTGAILGALGGFTSPIRPQLGVHLWRDGLLTALTSDCCAGSIVAGDYAVFDNGPGLYRVNTVSGMSTLVTTANRWPVAVAADGTVIFTNLDDHLVRDRAGQQMVLADEPLRAHINPHTNGQTVIYTQRAAQGGYATAVISGSGAPELLTPFRSVLSECYCAIAGDWLVFSDAGAQGQRQVFKRNPQGTITQITDFLASSTIDRLAGNGDVMFTSGGQRYLSRGTALIPISGPTGKSYWVNDAWYIAMGATLLAVDTSDLEAP